MSWKSRLMLPPQCGIGLELKISSDLRRNCRIQSGSLLMSEIWLTTSAFSPLWALNTALDSVRKSYLLISDGTDVSRTSVDILFSPLGERLIGFSVRFR